MRFLRIVVNIPVTLASFRHLSLMKRHLLAGIALLASVQFSSAQCTEEDNPKILVVGDSWAAFMNNDGTITNALRRWGHSDKRHLSNAIVAENGSETNDFLEASKQTEIQSLLLANPTIEVVHLSIGGNDVMGDWDVTFTQAATDTLEAQVTVRLNAIIDFIKSVRPNIRIVWSGYVYPNFGEVIGILNQNAQTAHPFYDTWSGMGFPTFLQINSILNSFSATVEAYAAVDPQVDFVKCTGVLQHVFGQPTPLGVAPGGSYAQFAAPIIEGYPEYPSPMNTMRDYFFFKDCFHLSAAGYNAFIDYQFQKFYHKFFMDDQYLVVTEDALSGSVSSDGTVSTSPMLGEMGGVDHATVLTFNTGSMFESAVTKASIFMRRTNLEGGNPYANGVEVRVVAGNFGATATVEAEDFSATGDAEGSSCVFGSNGGDGHWVRLELPENLLPFIANDANVQFAISTPGVTGAMVTFSDGRNPDFAPVLNLTYAETPSSVHDVAKGAALKMYPNPTNGLLTVVSAEERILSMNVISMLGAVVLVSTDGNNAVDMSALPSGPYILQVTTDKQVSWQRVVRQ